VIPEGDAERLEWEQSPESHTPAEAARAYLAELDVVFSAHPPTPEQAELYPQVRAAMKLAAAEVLRLVPISVEQRTALRHLQEAMFWANAAIARRHPSRTAPAPPDGI